jgi:hypothetical protein
MLARLGSLVFEGLTGVLGSGIGCFRALDFTSALVSIALWVIPLLLQRRERGGGVLRLHRRLPRLASAYETVMSLDGPSRM